MKITQFEQSGLIIETSNGYKLAIDIASYTPIENLEVHPDAMLISHLHGDHFSVEHIKRLLPKRLYVSQECADLLVGEALDLEIVIVKVGDVVCIDNFTVTTFEVDHGPNVKVRPKENFGFLIEVENQKVYFAGDMYFASGLDVSNLEVDRAFIPVGGFYVFGPQEASTFVKQFKKIETITPIHYEYAPEMKEQFEKLLT